MESTGKSATSRMQLVLAFVLSLACALPFVDKPVHQDDWAYLRVAELLADHPDDLLEQKTIYQGMETTAAQGILHGPVWIYVLRACQVVSGGDGVLLAHWLSALCLALVGLSMASLAGRLGLPPVATALLVVVSPVPLVLAGNVMTDMPMLALFCVSIALAVRGIERGSLLALVLAGVAGAFCGLTRLHGLAVLPMLLALPLAWPRWRFAEAGPGGALPRLGVRHFAGFFVGVVIVAVHHVRTFVLSEQTEAIRAAGALSELDIDRTTSALAAAAAMGGTWLAFALGWLAAPRALLAGLRRRGALVALGLGLVVGIGLAVVAEGRHSVQPVGLNLGLQRALFLLAGVGGLFALRSLWRGAGREVPGGLSRFGTWRENHGQLLFFFFWLAGFLFTAWVAVPFGSTRYALPAIPAVVLFAALATRDLVGPRGLFAALVPTALVGFGSAIADERAAEVYPELAREVAEQQEELGDIWIWGELDFRWYLEEEPALAEANNGGRPKILSRWNNRPAAGDHIFKSAICTAGSDGLSGTYKLAPKLVTRMRNAGGRTFSDDWPLRVHNPYVSAGFYGAEGGLLPFAFAGSAEEKALGENGLVPHDIVTVFRIEDANWFLTNFERALLESAAPRILAQGNIHIKSFLPYNGVELSLAERPAVFLAFPGRVTWNAVDVAADATELEVFVAEHNLAMYPGYEGPGGIARIRIAGKIAWERSIDARRVEEDRAWITASVDMTPYQGQVVDISFEVSAAGPAVGEGPPKTFFGFADPVLR